MTVLVAIILQTMIFELLVRRSFPDVRSAGWLHCDLKGGIGWLGIRWPLWLGALVAAEHAEEVGDFLQVI